MSFESFYTRIIYECSVIIDSSIFDIFMSMYIWIAAQNVYIDSSEHTVQLTTLLLMAYNALGSTYINGCDFDIMYDEMFIDQ